MAAGSPPKALGKLVPKVEENGFSPSVASCWHYIPNAGDESKTLVCAQTIVCLFTFRRFSVRVCPTLSYMICPNLVQCVSSPLGKHQKGQNQSDCYLNQNQNKKKRRWSWVYKQKNQRK